MNEKTSNHALESPLRRKTIKTLAAGVGALAGSTVLPDKWVKPIIQGIALPAHAQTSAPAFAFCGGTHELTLVDGHSGTDEMTIEASGCITPAQANVELELTLEGYETPAITRSDEAKDTNNSSVLAALSGALVPSAHAAPTPRCTLKVKVKTTEGGQYRARFKLSCGKGIKQAVMHALLNGVSARYLGWLDISPCNPCRHTQPVVEGKTAAVPYEGDCADFMVMDVRKNLGLALYVNDVLTIGAAALYLNDEYKVVSISPTPINVWVDILRCTIGPQSYSVGTFNKDGVIEQYIIDTSYIEYVKRVEYS